MLGFFALLLIAGNITTTNLIGNAIRAFAELPGGIEAARDLEMQLAVEETLRYYSSIQGVRRIATEDVELAGETIAAGDELVAWLGSANRDPATFEAPDEFRPERGATRYLAFGSGIHFCLGAHLARLEARIALETLFEAFDHVEAVGQDLEPTDSTFVYGVQELPIAVE